VDNISSSDHLICRERGLCSFETKSSYGDFSLYASTSS